MRKRPKKGKNRWSAEEKVHGEVKRVMEREMEGFKRAAAAAELE